MSSESDATRITIKQEFKQKFKKACWISPSLIVSRETPDLNELLNSDNRIIRTIALLKHIQYLREIVDEKIMDKSTLEDFKSYLQESYRDYPETKIETLLMSVVKLIEKIPCDSLQSQKRLFYDSFNELLIVSDLKPILTFEKSLQLQPFS